MMKTIKLLFLAGALFNAVLFSANGSMPSEFTYQGRAQVAGTNFTGTGQFKFALVTSTNANRQATATVTTSGGYVTIITVTDNGSGYIAAPKVTISGGNGSGASATAVVSGGVVTEIDIDTGKNGSGYTTDPTVTIDPPPAELTFKTYWSNDGTSMAGSEPSAGVSVDVNNGLFTVAVGDTTLPNMSAPMDAELFNQPNLQLRIWFSDGVNGFTVLDPPQNLTPAPYAAFASIAGKLSGTLPATQLTGTIPSSQLSDSVLNSQLANSAVTVKAGPGLGGGGSVSLGGSTTLTNTGVLSVTGGADINATMSGGTVTLSVNASSASQADALVKRDDHNGFGADYVTLNRALYLPLTSAQGAGMIFMNGAPFLHAYRLESFFAGLSAGNLTMKGSFNTGIGYGTLCNNDTGNSNTGNGADVLFMNTSGSENTGMGYRALAANGVGNQNTALGTMTLTSNTSGGGNTAVGYESLNSNTTGKDNSAYGYDAMYCNTNGNYNTAQGGYALYWNTRGSNNTANGYNALNANDAGSCNTANGFGALVNIANGQFNIGLGYYAGSALTTGSNDICIGNSGVSGNNNTIRIGGSSHKSAYIAGIYGTTASSGAAVFVNSSGQLGTLTSSRQFKENIQPMAEASDVLYALHPVTFRYKQEIDPQGVPQFGLIAEDVDKVDPDLVIRDDQHGIYTVRYEAVNAMLVNEFLKQHRQAQDQSAEIQALKQQNASLEKRLVALEQLVAPQAGK